MTHFTAVVKFDVNLETRVVYAFCHHEYNICLILFYILSHFNISQSLPIRALVFCGMRTQATIFQHSLACEKKQKNTKRQKRRRQKQQENNQTAVLALC